LLLEGYYSTLSSLFLSQLYNIWYNKKVN